MSASPSLPDGVPTQTNANCAVLSPSVVVEGKAQAAGLEVLDDDLLQAWLVDRQLASTEPFHLARVDVDADDLIAQLGETGGGDQTNVVRPDDSDGGHYFGV